MVFDCVDGYPGTDPEAVMVTGEGSCRRSCVTVRDIAGRGQPGRRVLDRRPAERLAQRRRSSIERPAQVGKPRGGRAGFGGRCPDENEERVRVEAWTRFYRARSRKASGKSRSRRGALSRKYLRSLEPGAETAAVVRLLPSVDTCESADTEWACEPRQLGRSAHSIPRPSSRTFKRLVAEPPQSNFDLLAWFSEEERDVCGSCGERACVSLPAALASFCLACGAVSIDGVRIDADLRIAS